MQERIDHNKTWVITCSLKANDKNGAPYRKLKLQDLETKNSIKVNIFSLENFSKSDFRLGNQIRITDSQSFNKRFDNYIVNKFTVEKLGKLGLNEREIEASFSELKDYIDKINDMKLKEFIASLLAEYSEKFRKSPGGLSRHHCYVGGLLTHTLECLRYAETLAPHLRNIDDDMDSIYAACILHDFGKVLEYEIDVESGETITDSNFYKKWITHSQWGYTQCMAAGFDKVAKMIATHHSRLEWGAVLDLDKERHKDKEELEPIYYLMYHIDDLSAKFGKTTVLDL
ncbi:MAG: HD domain-containing protein [Holosporales bacterium]|jgi:putative nucleotidyltransferase with HDIG domain|nr:HD domain-containing protein [Holosporales bacterium]